ncbi:MAG: hypothetical protein ACXW2E_00290 [Nitrososphaeraceae archaeon]
MFFISILSLAALGIAGSAAYFSVYGLANTFHSNFWPVVIMGSALEIGKLTAASFLYRFWSSTTILLKWYLLIGIAGLMILTSWGIFGFLSAGYLTDSLPFKQLEQQISLLDEEKLRLQHRKEQIDNQIANLPSDYSKSRLKLMNGFKAEQEQITSRISILDKDILHNKTQIIQAEAHVGPVVYIAKALHQTVDDATKYLIYLIIFVFDPMAVALTIAVNVSLRARKETLTAIPCDIILPKKELLFDIVDNNQINDIIQEESQEESQEEYHTVTTTSENIPEKPWYKDDMVQLDNITINPSYIDKSELPLSSDSLDSHKKDNSEIHPLYYPSSLGVNSVLPTNPLFNRYNYFKQLANQGVMLTREERWEFETIKANLHQQGYNVYI